MDIKIGKSARVCGGCEKNFEHEQEIFSLVRISENVLVRDDYCGACWSPDLGENAFSSWTSHFYDPAVAEQQPPEAFSPLRQTFYEAVEEKGRAQLAMAYLAGQLLRRQKVFRFIKETKDPDTEASSLLFNDRIGNRLIEVQDPNLSHAEMDEGRKLLIARLAEIEQPDETDEPENETIDSGEEIAVTASEPVDEA